MKKVKVFLKYFGVVLGGLLIAVIFLGVLGYSLPKVRSFVFQLREAKYNREYYKMMEEREIALRNDNVGGKTPEETIQMFIQALVKKDVDSASVLYQIEDRDSVESSLEGVLQRDGDFKAVINNFSEYLRMDGIYVTESVYSVGGEDALVLEKNNYNDVWKLIR